MKRWPFRKINAINNMIKELDEVDGNIPDNINFTMEDLVAKKALLMQYPDIDFNLLVTKYAGNCFRNKLKEVKSKSSSTSRSISPYSISFITHSTMKDNLISSPQPLRKRNNLALSHDRIEAAMILSSFS